MRTSCLICATAGIMSFLGCGWSQAVVTPAGAAKVTETGKDKGTVEMAVGGQKVKGDYDLGKIPEDFPKDIPIYKSYQRAMSVNAGISRSLNLFSDDARSAISAFYEKELAAAGWKVSKVKGLPEADDFDAT